VRSLRIVRSFVIRLFFSALVIFSLALSLVRAGIYMPETFKRETKYGLTCLTTTDKGLLNYLQTVQEQVTEWLQTGEIQRLVLVVNGVDTMETLERWQFNVIVDDESSTGENKIPNENDKEPLAAGGKSIKDIHNEIQAIIRQITASVTFLPLLQEPCTFDLLVYTAKDVKAPTKWADSDPCYILNSAEVKLRSFTTSVHKIDSMVAYKEAEEWEL
jgi:mitotic spindle assembly checkpoint protein MAD2